MHPRAAEFEDRVEAEHGLAIAVREFPGGRKTAADVAEAIGWEVRGSRARSSFERPRS